MVTEPSLSGLSDLERVLRIADAVGRPIATADEAREYLSLT